MDSAGASFADDSAVYANTGGYFSYAADAHGDDGHEDGPVDISEADERMKRYYGIVPKQPASAGSPAAAAVNDKGEIRTVRIVKRESEKRQRSKPRYDDVDELTEEESVNDDPLLDDPVISQFSHVLTLPRKGSKRDERADKRAQRNSIAGSSDTAEQWRGSLRPRRNLSAVSRMIFTFF